MAIVTHCPNGHRLKVKDHLAGTTGRCPTCGTRFRIESTADLPLARLVPLAAEVVATLPRARPLGSAPRSPLPPSGSAAEAGPPAADPADAPTVREPEPTQAREASLHAVIAERPDLTWCIAFPGGDPTEPLDAPTMQAWLDGGHATGTEVVWRSDWPEWRPVQDVFPGLFGDFRP